MGKVDRLRNRVEPFAALFRHSTCQHMTLPAGPASLHRRTQSMSLYVWIGHSWFNSQLRRVVPTPLFLSRYIYHLSMTLPYHGHR